MPEIPEKILSLARAIHDAGGRALLVGGCVRDELMGKQPKDWDLEVYDLDAARVREILDQFGPVNIVGESLLFTSSVMILMFRSRVASASRDAVIRAL